MWRKKQGSRGRKSTWEKTSTRATHFSRAWDVTHRESPRRLRVLSYDTVIVDFTCVYRNYWNTLYTGTTAAANRLWYVFFCARKLRDDKATGKYMCAYLRCTRRTLQQCTDEDASVNVWKGISKTDAARRTVK